jgi:hypothetical protein
MVAAGLWRPQARKLGEKHFWRPRRSGYGELVQWDTSNHDWLEGRGEAVRYLVRWIDDATSRSGGRFVGKPRFAFSSGVTKFLGSTSSTCTTSAFAVLEKISTFQHTKEELLRQVLHLDGRKPAASNVGVKRISVGFAQ